MKQWNVTDLLSGLRAFPQDRAIPGLRIVAYSMRPWHLAVNQWDFDARGNWSDAPAVLAHKQADWLEGRIGTFINGRKYQLKRDTPVVVSSGGDGYGCPLEGIHTDGSFNGQLRWGWPS